MADEERIIKLQGTQQELMQLIPQLKMMYQLFEKFNDMGLYSMPDIRFQDTVKYTPKIKLVFYQLSHETRDDLPRVNGEISYRIMGETNETFTPLNAKVRAQKIKTLFTEPSLFIWRKGKLIVSYVDINKGYNFKLYVKNEAEGRRIITQVMAIENQTPDWSNLAIHESRDSYPEVTGTKRVYGRQYRLPRRRPLEDVPFRYAELLLHQMPKPITLVDTFGNRGEPLVSPWSSEALYPLIDS